MPIAWTNISFFSRLFGLFFKFGVFFVRLRHYQSSVFISHQSTEYKLDRVCSVDVLFHFVHKKQRIQNANKWSNSNIHQQKNYTAHGLMYERKRNRIEFKIYVYVRRRRRWVNKIAARVGSAHCSTEKHRIA